MMPAFLVDTNHLSDAVRKVSHLRDRMQQARLRGIRFGTCVHVLCELEAGFCGLSRSEGPRKTLERLLKQKTVRQWPIQRPVIELFGQIHLELERRGRSLSHVDIVLAALARHRKVTILTTDRDFEALPDIRTENWLTS